MLEHLPPGIGDTIEEAWYNADKKAVEGAEAKGTCVSRWTEAKYCSQPANLGGKWQCIAAYANHLGSCNHTWRDDAREFAKAYANYKVSGDQ